MNEKRIVVASEFSRVPSGRDEGHGIYNGKYFREKFLLPALRDYDRVVVNFNGVLTRGSSFFEEAFGGLIRVDGLSLQEIRGKLVIETNKGVVVSMINQYLEDADRAKSK